MLALCVCYTSGVKSNIRLDGGAALEEASSSSLPRLRPPCGGPRFAADMLSCSGGELFNVSGVQLVCDLVSYYLMWDVCWLLVRGCLVLAWAVST